ncbi:S-methyl-5'-thioinosine phosphorylase [Immundisolibacter sp.]|uniref:S-methyl-5'-thioinosine phosphorylase n=1 Tax=Immundisolibacter sp. TaxID=1934948 RepID=UPI003567B673
MIAIIGGSGLDHWSRLDGFAPTTLTTPFGDPAAPLLCGDIDGVAVCFLPRHGADHTLPPHRINYRANLWACKTVGARAIVAVATVGAISAHIGPGTLVLPDQIIDYTSGREASFFDGTDQTVQHVEFTEPYDAVVRKALHDAAVASGVDLRDGGTYAATQGPRLETRAEIDRLERDGCHIVGMTGMPEAALARELALPYACLALVANRAAGRGSSSLLAEIEQHLASGIACAQSLLLEALPQLAGRV